MLVVHFQGGVDVAVPGHGGSGSQPDLVDLGGGGRVPEGQEGSQAGPEAVRLKTQQAARRPRRQGQVAPGQERPGKVQHCPHHRSARKRHCRQFRPRQVRGTWALYCFPPPPIFWKTRFCKTSLHLGREKLGKLRCIFEIFGKPLCILEKFGKLRCIFEIFGKLRCIFEIFGKLRCILEKFGKLPCILEKFEKLRCIFEIFGKLRCILENLGKLPCILQKFGKLRCIFEIFGNLCCILENLGKLRCILENFGKLACILENLGKLRCILENFGKLACILCLQHHGREGVQMGEPAAILLDERARRAVHPAVHRPVRLRLRVHGAQRAPRHHSPHRQNLPHSHTGHYVNIVLLRNHRRLRVVGQLADCVFGRLCSWPTEFIHHSGNRPKIGFIFQKKNEIRFS